MVALLAWLLLFSPLLAAAGIAGFCIHRQRLGAALAVGGLAISFLCTIILLVLSVAGAIQLPYEVSVRWIVLPDLLVPFGVLITRLSLLMLLVVTGVGSAIFVYSIGYMAKDPGYSRYFALLSLFAFSMLMIVVANNWIELFLGWELVGFCSYALIGHWYERPAAADAGKKAFMVNRVADFGFLLGIIALWAYSSPIPAERTVHFLVLQERLPQLLQSGWLSTGTLSLIGLLIFCGVIGKSAQAPLHVWLPDAMEGPTSVSALIHAATMVAAGVYLLCRVFWLYEPLPSVLTVIAWVGGLTALLMACLALVEADLKRILAYSTLSQLGYMVMALGLGGAIAGMYHLTTHAFFKALLFLAAGSIIHGAHRQNIWELGGLRRTMPLTSLAFLIGALALAGTPLLSGFFSKDEILVLAREQNTWLYVLATCTAGLTAFYIARAWFVAFAGGAARGVQPHESPPIMLAPLAALAFFSIVGGYLGIPRFLGAHPEHFHWDVAGTAFLMVALGITAAWLIYSKQLISAQMLTRRLAWPHRLLMKRYYIDDAYTWYVERVQQRLIAGMCALFERVVIIGFVVNGTARITQSTGRLIRYCQTGKTQAYALSFFIGIVAFLYLAIRAYP